MRIYGKGGSRYVERGWYVEQTFDAGYIIVARGGEYGNTAWLLKTDSAGDTLWTKLFTNSEWITSMCFSVQQTFDGGYILTGYVSPLGSSHKLLLLKTDSAGDTLWTKLYGGEGSWDQGVSVRQTPDGGYIVAGSKSQSYTEGQTDVWLLKMDSLGDTLWTRLYGWEEYDNGYSVQETRDGGYIITGERDCHGFTQGSLWLLKTDSLGDTLWTHTYGNQSMARSVQETEDDGYIIVGTKDYLFTLSGEVWLLKTDSLGDTLWTRTFGGESIEEGISVEQTSDGGYILTGYTQSFGAGSDDLWLLKTDSAGDTLWTRLYGGAGADRGECVHQISDGGYIITGVTRSFGEDDEDLWLIKTDSLGYVAITEQPVRESVIRLEASLNRLFYDVSGSVTGEAKLTLYSADGRRILEETIQGKGVWDAPPLPQGVYFARVKDNSASATAKVVILR
jgi:hypothetical protein